MKLFHWSLENRMVLFDSHVQRGYLGLLWNTPCSVWWLGAPLATAMSNTVTCPQGCRGITLSGQHHGITPTQATALLCLEAFLYSKVTWGAIRRLSKTDSEQAWPLHRLSFAKITISAGKSQGEDFFLYLIKAIQLPPFRALYISIT